MISQHIIDRVNDATDIVELLKEDHVELRKSGANYTACCPFHNERNPSFSVNTRGNYCHCFSCGKGGGPIKYIQLTQGMSFPEAVEYLARRANIEMERQDTDFSETDRAKEQHRELLRISTQKIAEFYAQSLFDDTSESQSALAYARERWKHDEIIKMFGIGYAPKKGLQEFAKKHLIPKEVLLELGLIKPSEYGDGYYDFFRNRLIFVLADRYGRPIAFIARVLDNSKPKYTNSPESEIFKKGKFLYGLHLATRDAVKNDKMYIVEGNPDVIRLQSIGVMNTVAPLGTAMSKEQFDLFKRYTSRVCFIPDADEIKGNDNPPGTQAVIDNGLLALSLGFIVTVKEIPVAEDGSKQDADSYIHSSEALSAIEEQDFLVWYAKKLFVKASSSDDKAKIVDSIAEHAANIKSATHLNMLTSALAKVDGTKKLWETAIEGVKGKRKQEEMLRSGSIVNLEEMEEYGFQIGGGKYFAIGKDGKQWDWSNFTMTPLFHVKDPNNSLRLYLIRNNKGQEDMLEFTQDELVSLTAFRKKIGGSGNYVWLAKEQQLVQLTRYLYEHTETAKKIDVLGWQREGFFAFGNGIFTTEFVKVDDMGIVRLPNLGAYYLPAFSAVYAEFEQYYEFERLFIHQNTSDLPMRQYCQQVIDVFGDYGKVALGFAFATMFRDVVFAVAEHFPLLNLYGVKGTGKSELAHSLMAFFTKQKKPINIRTSTVPSISSAAGQVCNACMFFDELKNDIEPAKREVLKSFWDGNGRSRMNMDDKKREVSKVTAGIILAGQEMATADPALVSRVILLAYKHQASFTTDQKRAFRELLRIRNLGVTHLTLEILQKRKYFETEFKQAYLDTLAEMNAKLEDEKIEDRILGNWVIPLATLRVLIPVLDLPMNYGDLVNVCLNGIRYQNSKVADTNELASFWSMVSVMLRDGRIFPGADYHIKDISKIRYLKSAEVTLYNGTRKILMLVFNRVAQLYATMSRSKDATAIPAPTLLDYLRNHSSYLGEYKVRCDVRNNGQLVIDSKDMGNGRFQTRKQTTVENVLCFDYEQIVKEYNITLETDMVSKDAVEPIDEE